MKEALFTSYQCHNDELFAKVITFYFEEGAKIADTTFGKGVFWRKVDLSKYDLWKSDILTVPDAQYDCTKLPYFDKSFDGVVFDPPYVHNPGNLIVDANYRNAETTKGFYHRDIINFYREGMKEAKRVLKPGGYLLVKCKDEIESSKQCWSHIEIYEIARELGMVGKDLFVVTQKVKPYIQHKNQQHARKNHSYLWVFKK